MAIAISRAANFTDEPHVRLLLLVRVVTVYLEHLHVLGFGLEKRNVGAYYA